MKIGSSRKIKTLASALLTTLVICSILSIFVLYYLSLIDQQSYLNTRSQTWNMAISVSEAGVEDGLQQLNNAFPNMNTDGWTYNGSSYYWKSNSLPDGNGYTSYIIITNSLNPVVVARAYVNMPPTYAKKATSSLLATVGFSSPNTPADPVTRAIQVTCAKKSLFQVAMVAKQNIDLNGNGITTDSFDSSMPGIKSNPMGMYDSSKAGSKGDIATNLGVIDSIAGGNAKVFGHAHTGPGSPSTALQIGPNGYVGSMTDQSVVGAGAVDPGWWLPDSNFTFPDTTMPNYAAWTTLPVTGGVLVVTAPVLVTNTYTATPTYPTQPTVSGVTTNCIPGVYNIDKFFLPAPGTYCGTITTNGNKYSFYTSLGLTYNYALYDTNMVTTTNKYDNILWGNAGYTNYYVANSLSGSTIVVGPNVVLALPNGLNMSGGSDQFTVSSGSSVIVYSGGNSCTIGGNGVVNQSGYAGNFVLYAAPSVTSFSFSGNGTFSGVLVAPNAAITMNGGGSGNQDFCGCVIANSVTMNGHFNFHYDEALAGANKNGRFLITAWNEIK